VKTTLIALCLGGLLLPRAAWAALRVVVRAESATDRALLLRARGDASDLDVELIEASAGPLEATAAQQLRTAAALAEAHEGALVFWFELPPPPRQLQIYIADPRHGRTYVRTIEQAAGSGAAPGSPALEAAALVVRGALRAFVNGGEIGIAPVTLAPEVAAVREIDAAREVAASAPVPSPRRPGFVLTLGWQFAFDGQSPHGQMGLYADLGLLLRRIALGVEVAAPLPATVPGSLATVELSRYTAAVFAGWRFDFRHAFELEPRLELGYAGFRRSTATVASGLIAAPSALTSSLLLGAALDARYTPRRGPFAIGLQLGFDYLPEAPILVYELGGVAQIPRALWLVQPKVSLYLGGVWR
jgi:hypothetical protein